MIPIRHWTLVRAGKLSISANFASYNCQKYHFKVVFHSFHEQKHAMWSLCVVCIICSALTLYVYIVWGLSMIAWTAHLRNTDGQTIEGDRYFLAMGDKMVYTEKEKAALVVFAFIIICSVTEIGLAATMIKICETMTPQVSSNWAAYYQVLFPQFLPRIVPFEFPGVTL